MTRMDDDWRADYAAKRLMDDARHALDPVLAEPRFSRFSLDEWAAMDLVWAALKRESDRIVEVWN